MKKLWELLKMGFKSLFIAPVLDYESANSIAKFGIILDDKAKFKRY